MDQPYDRIAELYDAEHASFADDVVLYRELARRTDGPVLEAMCGSGRLLVPLARAGYAVVGVDSSRAMLDRAQDAAVQAGVAARITLHHGDIRDPLPITDAALAIVALNSFMHLTSSADQIRVLGRLHAALKPGGLLVLDLLNLDPATIIAYDGSLVFDQTLQLDDGRLAQKFVAQRADSGSQLLDVTFFYDTLDGVSVTRVTTSFTLRWLYRFEIEHLLARCGFVIETVAGGYDLEPYTGRSDQLVVVARRG